PAFCAATNFAATISSVSPNSVLRSECPTSTCEQPTSCNMGPDTSPVKAPCSAWCRFCAPSRREDPAMAAATCARCTKAGHTSTSTASSSAANPPLRAWTRASACAFWPCIFQLAATSGRLTMNPFSGRLKKGRKSSRNPAAVQPIRRPKLLRGHSRHFGRHHRRQLLCQPRHLGAVLALHHHPYHGLGARRPQQHTPVAAQG